MRRTGFKRPAYERKPSPVIGMAPGSTAHCRMSAVSAVLMVQPKSEPARHEGYRRLVAAMPCINCFAPPPSQCAHSNLGKGMSLKADDRESFPLCAPSYGKPGCHVELDQAGRYSKSQRRELEELWSRATRAAIRNAGQWPADLAPWPEDETEETA